MTVYGWVKAFHVLMALWVAVSAFGGTVIRASLQRAPDFAAKVAVMRVGVRIGMVFGFLGGTLVGLSGFLLLMLNPGVFQLAHGWIDASIALWVVLYSLNLLVTGPRMKKLLAAGEASLAEGGPNEEFKRLMAKPIPRVVADLPPVAVVIFVLLMVLKPF
jgi:uncharacterized membrane protein